MMLLDIKDLKVFYDGASIIKGISLKVDKGEIVTIIGNNGAGKTTTLRVISGLKRADAGEIWFDGERVDRMSPQDIVRLGICHVPQGRDLFQYMSVEENLRLGAYLRKDRVQIAMDLKNMFGHFPILGKRKNQKAGTLSGGEQQMLAIAIALMGRPKLLLMDEPSAGLSPMMVDELSETIKEINDVGTSILLVEQNAELALRLAKRGYVLETGNILLEGNTENLVNNEIVRRAYLGV
jgi:branched-chain amino acid transport system ATP-binding protein